MTQPRLSVDHIRSLWTWGIALLIAYFVYLSCAGFVHRMGYGVGRDAQLFHWIAGRLLSGDVPYRDIFDFNLPGTYWLHMLLLRLFGNADRAFVLYDTLWLTLTTFWLSAWAWNRSKILALWLGMLWFTRHITTAEGFLLQRDFLMVPFILMAAWLLVFALERGKHYLYCFLAGMLTAYAASIKPTALLLCALYVLIILTYRPLPLAMRVLQSISYSAGGGLLIGAYAIWLHQTDAWPYFYEIMVEFVPLFRTAFSPLWQGGKMAPPEDWTMLYVAALFSAMAIGWVWRYAREAFDVRFCVVAVTCVFAIVHAHFQIKGWYYHYYPFFAFFPLLIAMAIAAARPHQLHNKWYYAASILLLIGLSFNVATKAPRPFKPSNSSAYKMEFTANLHKEIIDAAQYMPPDIKESFLTSPQKPILWLTFFCDRCNLWYGAYHFGWEAVGRYTFLTPLLHRHKPYSIKARADFVQKFLATPPPIIIYSGNGGAFWSITREHEALASLMARSYKSYVSSDLYTIMVRVQ